MRRRQAVIGQGSTLRRQGPACLSPSSSQWPGSVPLSGDRAQDPRVLEPPQECECPKMPAGFPYDMEGRNQPAAPPHCRPPLEEPDDAQRDSFKWFQKPITALEPGALPTSPLCPLNHPLNAPRVFENMALNEVKQLAQTLAARKQKGAELLPKATSSLGTQTGPDR